MLFESLLVPASGVLGFVKLKLATQTLIDLEEQRQVVDSRLDIESPVYFLRKRKDTDFWYSYSIFTVVMVFKLSIPARGD